MFEQGRLKFDLLVMFSYQLLLFYSNQQLFPVLLEYMPKTMCKGTQCFSMEGTKCISEATLLCDDKLVNATQCSDKYAYKEFYSAAMELEYYCHVPKFLSLTFFQFCGLFVGTFSLGYVADAIGRRSTLLVCVIMGIPCLALSAFFSNSLLVFYLLRFVIGFTTGGTLIVGWAYHSELISAQHRFKLRTFINWANSRIIVVFISWLAVDWKLSSYICSGLYLICLGVLFFLPESPMWLRSKGYFEREEQAWKKIAWFCGAQYDIVPPSTATTASAPKGIKLMDVFRHPVLRIYLGVMSVMWFSQGILVYTMDLGSDKMTEGLFLGQFLSCICLSLGSVTFGFLDHFLPWFGRRQAFLIPVSIFVASVAALCGIEIFGLRSTWWYTAMYLVGSVAIYLSWEPCYLAITELMPTEVRATAASFCNTLNRVANLLSTQMEAFRDGHQALIFGICVVVGIMELGSAAKFLPETKNREVDVIFITEETDKEEQKHSISRRMTNSLRRRPRSVEEDKEDVLSTDV